jgi:hypothetical protein
MSLADAVSGMKNTFSLPSGTIVIYCYPKMAYMDKTRIFIGSSSEGLNLATAIFSNLQLDTEPILWKHGLFLPGKFPFEVLEEQLRRY